jgi:sugar/nucleoside kinase (ribokinase family)
MFSPGGQVASAMVACAKLGLRVEYIGTMGDDERGRIQRDSLLGTGINLDDVQIRPGCANQSAYIVIDQSTGERTVLWRRPDCLRLTPEEIQPEMITAGPSAAYRRPRYARRGPRRRDCPRARHPGHGGRRYGLPWLRPCPTQHRLPDHQF